jgi:hypothetical protein
MTTETKTVGVDPLVHADAEAVLRHAFHGEPLDAEVARRVQERAAQVTAEVYRLHGEIDTETISALFAMRTRHEAQGGHEVIQREQHFPRWIGNLLKAVQRIG